MSSTEMLWRGWFSPMKEWNEFGELELDDPGRVPAGWRKQNCAPTKCHNTRKGPVIQRVSIWIQRRYQLGWQGSVPPLWYLMPLVRLLLLWSCLWCRLLSVKSFPLLWKWLRIIQVLCWCQLLSCLHGDASTGKLWRPNPLIGIWVPIYLPCPRTAAVCCAKNCVHLAVQKEDARGTLLVGSKS